MVYEVCALVITIIVGVLGLEILLWVHSVRKVTGEAKQTLETINARLPGVLDDAQAVSAQVRDTAEQVGGTVSEMAVGLEDLKRNPLHYAATALLSVRQLVELWQDIRSRSKETKETADQNGEKVKSTEDFAQTE